MYLSVPQETFDTARANAVFISMVGSSVNGSNDEAADIDCIGVSIMGPEDVLGMSPFETAVFRTAETANTRSGPGDLDLTLYGARKFLSLAQAGNPSILESLHTPTRALVHITPVGLVLRAARDLFTTKQAGYRYLGYMRAQRERMVDSKAGVRAPRSNRPELVEAHGYDTKFAMHMIRLGLYGEELLTTGRIQMPSESMLLSSIRAGDLAYEEVIEFSHDLEAKLERTIKNADLPDKPASAIVNELSVELHWEQWGLRETP